MNLIAVLILLFGVSLAIWFILQNYDPIIILVLIIGVAVGAWQLLRRKSGENSEY